MQRLRVAGWVIGMAVLLTGLLSVPAGAQDQQTTGTDIQRLQDVVYDIGGDLANLRRQDPTRAEQFQARLDDLRDEVIYLKVKQRKEGVSRSEYNDVRSQLDNLQADVRNLATGAANREPPPPPRPSAVEQRTPPPQERTAADDRAADVQPARQGRSARADEVPAGTELDVRLEQGLNSGTAQVEDRFNATTVADLYNGNRLLVPAGSVVRGVVTSANKAGRVERTGKLTLSFDRVTVNGKSFPMHGTVTEALQSGGYRQDAGKIGAGAGVGAIIGGILGGFKGALAGILIGGGGVVAATEGQDVNLPAGTVLRIRLDSPLSVR
jgi:hypothetical protein